MRIFKPQCSRIKNIIARSFILASMATLAIALLGSVYFNHRGMQILQKNNMEKEQELLSAVLVPAIAISDVTEIRRLLSLVSDINQQFVVIDNSGNILMPDYEDLNLVKTSYLNNNSSLDCEAVKTGYQVINGNKFWINCSPLTTNGIDKKRVVGILISYSHNPSLWFSSLMFYFFGIAAISLLLNTLWFRRILSKRLLYPLTTLGTKITEVARSPFNSAICLDGVDNLPYEINEIKNAFKSVLAQLQIEYRQRTETEKKSALLDQAARVAHDVRSPIAAMEMSLHMLEKEISKDKILMLQVAIQSIRDVANNLLEQYRDNHKKTNPFISSQDDLNISRPILLHSLLEQVLSQKRYEWSQKTCELTFNSKPSVKDVWINVAPSDVKRMISNLLNNAIEACKSVAKIHIQLDRVNNFLVLSITDNGVGIPAEKINHYIAGESSKHKGIGLGLSSANKYMNSISGKLAISSQMNNGTSVRLTFNIDADPVWYPCQISLSENAHVIVLDDDIAMQTLWLHRLQKYSVKINIFSSYAETMHWIEQQENHLDRMVFLIDYELSEELTNGLTLLKHVNVKHRGYLITSHAEEVNIQKEVELLGIWLIPKMCASDIPIVFQ